MNSENIKLEKSWHKHLSGEFDQDYMLKLKKFLNSEYEKKKLIFPKGSEYFNAFNACPFEKVKVVIIGQDPYHGPDQAHGLCFSVKKGVRVPPSLRNIYKELKSDLNIEPPEHGYLQSWADQGVLLLNATLTVESGKAGSHQKKGWETFTDRVIEVLNHKRENLVFVLWGSYAQKKGKMIDRDRHLVLESPHPSPLSAHRGFFGSKPFSKIDQHLSKHGLPAVNWNIAD
ncbi:MAG: uracil-DNA glycosylase [Bdellovibrionaceae bacterium]|nr:uracil-DNA glycosylase [Pseudobdellovibrionaceae bacterium]